MPSAWSTILDELRGAIAVALPTFPPERIAFETPPSPQLGDVAIPCFTLRGSGVGSRGSGIERSLPQIAKNIAEQLAGHPLVARATAAGPYVNIVLDAAELARRVLTAVHEAGECYGDALTPLPLLSREREEEQRVRRRGAVPTSGALTTERARSEAEGRGSEGGIAASEHAGRASVPEVGTRPQPASERHRIVLEFISPNANKPLHLGHLRNAFLGESITRLLEAAGHTVHRVCLVNDRGVHIMKSLLAYSKWGAGATPESEGIKGDHFVGNWYVRFERERAKQRGALPPTPPLPAGGGEPEGAVTPLEREAAEWLRRWEAGDPEIRALWERMTGWVIAGFEETYRTIGIRFDRTYRESAIYEEGRRIVADALARDVFRFDAKRNIVAPLSERFSLDDKVVERADGTTVYATQDIALAAAKARDLHPDRSIIVTGNEQDYYFRQLFAILELLGMSGAHQYAHRSYGMVELPEGKMKSREGTVVDADDLINELTRLAEEEIRKRADAVPGEPAVGTTEPEVLVSDSALARAKDIALAAIRFHLLLVTPETTVTFDPKASLAFTGKTGPYLQYAHARLCAIRRRAHVQESGIRNQESGRPSPTHSPSLREGENREGVAALLTHPAEKALLLRIARFPDVVAAAADTLDPSTLSQFLYDFAKTFADFYRDVPVLQAETVELRNARLALCDATRLVLSRGLTVLGIAPLEEM